MSQKLIPLLTIGPLKIKKAAVKPTTIGGEAATVSKTPVYVYRKGILSNGESNHGCEKISKRFKAYDNDKVPVDLLEVCIRRVLMRVHVSGSLAFVWRCGCLEFT